MISTARMSLLLRRKYNRGVLNPIRPEKTNMEKADLLLDHAHVLTMDGDYRTFSDGAVAVRGDSILAVGSSAELKDAYAPAETVDCRGSILMPALVNAHTHAPMTLMRGLADDLRLEVWLLGYMMPIERQFVSPEFVRLGTRLACAEMIRGGIGTFCDMYYFEEEIAAATAEAGLRAVCTEAILKHPSPDSESYEDGLERTREFIRSWKDHALILPAVAPHAPYTCTEEIIRACTELALEFGVPLHIHLAETAQEAETARREYGMPEILYLKKLGMFAAKVTGAHCVHIDEEEMRALAESGAGVAHNPTSNLKLASGIAPVAKMLSAGLNVGIGTDGAASNNDLDMFEEMRLSALLAKGVSGIPTDVPARTALAMATRMGAAAIHLGDRTGSIEPGKRADLLLLDLDTVHASPKFERHPESVYARIVYSAKAGDVTDLMVNGAWLMRQRALQTLPEADLLAQAADMARRMDTFQSLRESSVLSKLIAIESATEEESFEVQVKVRLPEKFPLVERINRPGLETIYSRHYREFDTYFEFTAADQGRLRYRVDQILGPGGETLETRYRLTLMGPTAEREFARAVLLSRSRFLAPATHDLRFYREYFQPAREIEVAKERLRWKIRYRNTEFFINFDKPTKPPLPGRFLEIKSRTWSRRDAESKAGMILEILNLLDAGTAEAFRQDYVEMAERSRQKK
jgi:5-methylthioadenosine/S-adenosylhomocysteine deaminase